MTPDSSRVILALWSAWGLYWFIAARNVKSTLRPANVRARLLHEGPLVLCAVMFFSRKAVPEVLDRRFLPQSHELEVIGALVIALGLAFALWARHHLGRNWSSVVELKSEHALIRSGPYRLVRHPIYAGLFLALLGTTLAIGEWRDLLALAMAFMAIFLRVRAEDALMAEAFGASYEIYRRGTPALVPYLF